MALLLLAMVNGQVIRFDTETEEVVEIFHSADDDPLMGMCRTGEDLFFASLSRVYKISLKDFSVITKTRAYLPSPDFHQMNYYDGTLFTTATKRNQIWAFDSALHLKKRINIKPPNPARRVKYKKNYNHINSIVKEGEEFYINLNWFTNDQYADSGVLVTDGQFNEIRKFKFAWESHDFQFVDGKMMAICSTSGRDKQIMHPPQSGLMVDGELVWEHDPDESFCKGLCLDARYIYMCGGKKAIRTKRKNTLGIIYVIDRFNHSLVKKIENDKVKGIRGALAI